MRLSFSGAPEVGAPIGNGWSRIIDPHFVARHGPGVDSVEVLDPRHSEVITAFGVGAMSLRPGIDVVLVDVNLPPESRQGPAASAASPSA